MDTEKIRRYFEQDLYAQRSGIDKSSWGRIKRGEQNLSAVDLGEASCRLDCLPCEILGYDCPHHPSNRGDQKRP